MGLDLYSLSLSVFLSLSLSLSLSLILSFAEKVELLSKFCLPDGTTLGVRASVQLSPSRTRSGLKSFKP